MMRVARPVCGIAGLFVCMACVFAQTSAPPAAGIGLIDVLRASLKQNPNTLLQQQQVVSSQGAILQAQGQFDPLYSANVTRQRDLRPLRADEIRTLQTGGLFGVERQIVDSTSWQTGVNRQLLNGVVLEGGINVTSTDDSTLQQSGVPTQTIGRLSFAVRVPLLKNAGRETVGAGLFAAEAEHLATVYDLVQTNAQTLLNSALAYWDYLGRQRQLEVALAAERRARALTEEIEKLIANDQVPRAERELPLASFADKTVLRVQAEQAFVAARRTLARAIGLPAEQSIMLAQPADDFPKHDGRMLDANALPDNLRDQAIRSRADLEASRQREQSARFLLAAARNNLKPQIDLTVGAGYLSLAEGRGASDLDRVIAQARTGPTFNVTLGGQWPQGNSAARGTLLVQAATYDSSTIRIRELEASIVTSVAVDIEALRRAAKQLTEGDESVRRYTIALRNEETKRKLGQSTLIDVINIQDRLDGALIQQVQLQQNFAVAIAQLRFDLGTLVRKNGEAFDVRVEDLVSVSFQPQ